MGHHPVERTVYQEPEGETMNDTREEIVRTILGYEDGRHTPLRTLEIISILLKESSEEDALHSLLCKAVESWDNGKVPAEEVLDYISAVLRSSSPTWSDPSGE